MEEDSSLNDAPLFLGLDLSTQQLKAVALFEPLEPTRDSPRGARTFASTAAHLRLHSSFSVHFDQELSQYQTQGGVHAGDHQGCSSSSGHGGSGGDGGVNLLRTPGTVTSPVLMWVEALERLLDKMQQAQFPFQRVRCIGGAAQQHGSVYWSEQGRQALEGLHRTSLATNTDSKPLVEQFMDGFTVYASPIWQDTSTWRQCKQLEDFLSAKVNKYHGHMAGRTATQMAFAQQCEEEARRVSIQDGSSVRHHHQRPNYRVNHQGNLMADLTGSRAFERFTASQILKIAQIAPDAFHHTVRISLVSSFLASLLVGQFASIDIADGSGMNLLNIATKEWDPCLTDFIASARSPQDGPSPPFREVIARCDRRQQKALLKDHQQPLPSQDQTESSRTLQDEPTADVNRLMTLLGSVDVTGTAVQGMVAPWFATKYGFQPTTPVVSFTGDNPATALAMQLHPGDAIVSLGTSDTVMLYTSAANSIHINNNSSSSNITNAPDTMRRLLLLKDLNHNAATSILCHPTDPLGFLTLYCAKNGSLARERVRDEYAGGHWELFDELMVAALERRRQTWGARMHNVAEVAAERTGHGHAGAGAAGDGRPHVDDERTEDHRSCSFDHCKNVDQNDQDKKDHGAEKEKDEEDEGDWVTRFGFYFFEREIWPPVKGVHRFEDGRPVTEFTGKDEAAIRQQNVLAICEAQLLAMRVRAATTNASSLSSSSSPSSSPSFPPTGEGSHGTPRQRSSPMAASTTNTTTAVSRILATGGGSKSKAILQLMANVFNVPVVPMSEDGWAGSAAWGAACKAYLCSEKASHSDDNSKATATATDNSTTVRPTQGDQDKEDTPRIYYPDPVHAAYYAHVTKQFSELEYTLDHLKSLEL